MENKLIGYVVASAGFFLLGLIIPIILMASGYCLALTVREYKSGSRNEDRGGRPRKLY